ncbi:MAG: hypothetical protein WC725_05075 [Patescibacteria group bacterium]|jgi:hypothetical protein
MPATKHYYYIAGKGNDYGNVAIASTPTEAICLHVGEVYINDEEHLTNEYTICRECADKLVRSDENLEGISVIDVE